MAEHSQKFCMRLYLPSPSGRAMWPVVPVFMPFAGCPRHCVFCSQERQTGVRGNGVTEALQRLKAELAARRERGAGPCEVAFYGGTFTSLPWEAQKACLAVVECGKAMGEVKAARCSTRPDAVTPEGLRRLRDAGMDMVELGVQSFSDMALVSSGRGYDRAHAETGCRMVTAAGLALGIQLLPGLPGEEREEILHDVRRALDFSPSCLRLYPCLVVDGTRLAAMWRAGRYTPWTVEETVETLGRALALAWESGVPVIRLSLAPEPGFDAEVLAGPRHPALGSMIQGEALCLRISGWLEGSVSRRGRLRLPRRCQGYFAGQKGALLPRWRAMGVEPREVEWIDGEYAEWIPAD